MSEINTKEKSEFKEKLVAINRITKGKESQNKFPTL